MSTEPFFEQFERRQKMEQETETRRKAETTFREIEERYRAILEGIEDGYGEIDLSGNAVFFNDALCKIYDLPRHELMGFDTRKLLTEENKRRVFRTFDVVLRTGIPDKGFDYEIITKNGARKVTDVSISLMKNAEGLPIGYRCIIRDVTDRKWAEKELARHQSYLLAIFRGIQDAIITVDTEMRVVEANVALKKICGKNPAEIVGQVFTDCFNHCNKPCLEILVDALKKRTTVKEFRVQCRHTNRPHQIVVITASPLLDQNGEFMGAVMVVRDVTRLNDLERELRERHQFHNIIGKGKKMQEIYRLLENLADLETTVLVSGKSGTGKELVAKALHYGGNRAFKPFIKVNCSALAENLLESELFGHVKGAFTGAIKDKQGRFQAANGGTLLLDEIGDISPRIQLKLLRVLEEKEFERVGESTPIRVDVRVIACTNKDLKEKVRRGEFREDLYYRLKVVEVVLPSLRERIEDIPLLVDHFCTQFNKKFNKTIEGLSDEALKSLLNYSWPGNIRELEHVIESSFVLCHGRTITSEHLPLELQEYFHVKRPVLERKSDDDVKNILESLNKTGWNKTKAARLLGINRRTIYRKLDKYQLSKPHEYM